MAGEATTILVLGAVAIGGYYLLTRIKPGSGSDNSSSSSDISSSDSSGSSSSDSSNSSSGNRCGEYCRNLQCNTYSKKCKGNCSKCGSAKNNVPDSLDCNDGNTCGQRCAKGWCNSYLKCGCKLAGGCANCGQASNSGAGTNCGDLCRRRECSSWAKKGCTGCTQCNFSHLCSTFQCDSIKNGVCYVQGKKCPSLDSGGSSSNQPPKTNCSGKSGNCTWDCGNSFCWQGNDLQGRTFKTCVKRSNGNVSNGCNGARSEFCKRHGPCSSMAKVMRTYTRYSPAYLSQSYAAVVPRVTVS